MRQWKLFVTLIFSLFCTTIFAKSLSIRMHATAANGKGPYIGTVIASDTKRGLLLIPKLNGLTPGHHGFHLHTKASCVNFGKAAGGHWDPKNTGKHRGPYRPGGHQGDLPRLYVAPNGKATRGVLAPRLSVNNLRGHALIIHAVGDNYSDHPKKLGGGGARVACGVVR